MGTRYVAVDADGHQHLAGDDRHWPLPARSGRDWVPGEPLGPDGDRPPTTYSADELLDHLGAHVYAAELLDGGRARLVAGTAWSESLAARFALECAAHMLAQIPGTADAPLPSGDTLPETVALAEQLLDGTDGDGARLGRTARLAADRRLRRDAEEIGDEAFSASAEDEAGDLDALDDPVWATLAASRDAVLAAVEAVRHHAIPALAEHESRHFERLAEGDRAGIHLFDTPWGQMPVGGAPRYAPGWEAAKDTAERSRQAVADESGEGAGAAERAFQADLLATLLGPR